MPSQPSYGANIAFIEELHERYLADPLSVSDAWREFFQDYRPAPDDDRIYAELESQITGSPVASPSAAGAPIRTPESSQPVPPKRDLEDGVDRVALRGVASKIVENMEASLALPTATSVRNIPVKALEENRRIINMHQQLVGQPKASFTHVIAWALVRAIRSYPRMNSSYEMIDGTPHRIDHADVNLGIAIDVEKKDGTRSLVVPNIKAAQTMNFGQFLKAYNDLVRHARGGTLKIEDYQGTTISLTNPGTIGTVSSVPRLMPTQGAIIATGMIGYPAEYAATDRSVIAELGVSKVMTMTSTYDHRIIQGAESGAFLAEVHELMLGAHDFYDEIFRDLKVPFSPALWSRDDNRGLVSGGRQDNIARQAGVLSLINAYRVRGHLIADLDPLEFESTRHPELDPAFYGYTIWDLDREFTCGGLCNRQTAKLRDILDTLRATYCGKLGPEYMHSQDPTQKKWLQDRMEPTRNSEALDVEIKRRILKKLNDAEAFEKFLHTKYVGHKRFSLEGSETLVPMIDHLLNLCADNDVKEVVVGMAHRGRLNVLANVMDKSYEKIFSEFEGDLDPDTTQGSGDVKYHLGAAGEHHSPAGNTVKLTLASNPSHLEAVDPVVEGIARAKQKLYGDFRRLSVVPLLIHGDAAFAGQGVVAELLNLSQLPGFRTGGTIHVIVNNQIGFTTTSESARSSVYATDIAKMIQAPIFHVNGDDPEACIRAVKLAFDFRQEFKKDVVLDMFCYRRHGHNEADDPSMTQPRMYKLIKDHRSTRKLYTEALLRKGDIGPDEAERWLDDFREKMQTAFDRTHDTPEVQSTRAPLWSDEDVTGVQNEPSPDTTLPLDELRRIGEALVYLPKGFTLHPRLEGFFKKRRGMIEGTEPIDWAFGEALALGSILSEGYRVRLTGQDSGRGTFSQRHSVIYDYQSGKAWIPLNLTAKNPKFFSDMWQPEEGELDDLMQPPEERKGPPVNMAIYDSLLSEYAVLGFEYGYSVTDKDALVAWEAQFGDFMNGAQIIIDQFISSAEEKWNQHSGLVMLLPHGHEGQGPEHSSARLERFLTLCAEGNMQVVNPTTPAQYFHLLRRQMRLDPRKPLIVMAPKFLLRYPPAASRIEEFTSSGFHPVIDDHAFDRDEKGWDPKAVDRIVVTSGKIYYDLLKRRDELDKRNVALVRLEQFYPWPHQFLANTFDRYTKASEVAWVQEEPKNMGGWEFVDLRLMPLMGDRRLSYIGRPIAASPATGSHHRHDEQQQEIVRLAVEE